MKQFGKILTFELKYFFKNKVFVGVTLFIVAALTVVMFFPRISEAIGTEEDGQPQELPVMLVKAPEDAVDQVVLDTFAGLFEGYQVHLSAESDEQIQEYIAQGKAACAFVMTSPTSYVYYVETLSMYDMNMEIAGEALKQVYQMNAMMNGGMTQEDAAAIMNMQIDGRVENLGKNQAENFFYTYIMIFALYMVILLYGQMVATNVATEKSSRAMELLITSAKPASMMFGKVIASCMAGLIQLITIFGSALLLYQLNKSYWGGNVMMESIFNIPPELLVYMLVFFTLGFLTYAFMFGAVGSTASKLEDINTSVMPITMLFVAGFMVVMMGIGSGDVETPLMVACSYIPFTSPMAMFTRIAMSTVAWYEIAISVAILVASTAGIGILAAKIYRVGVLLYGKPPKISTILKTIFHH